MSSASLNFGTDLASALYHHINTSTAVLRASAESRPEDLRVQVFSAPQKSIVFDCHPFSFALRENSSFFMSFAHLIVVGRLMAFSLIFLRIVTIFFEENIVLGGSDECRRGVNVFASTLIFANSYIFFVLILARVFSDESGMRQLREVGNIRLLFGLAGN